MTPDVAPWNVALVLALTAAALAGVIVQRRSTARPWRWWGVSTFVLGWLAALAALLSPLERLGAEGSLTAHVAQHMLLGDLVAPLLLIGLPPVVSTRARRAYERRVRGTARCSRAVERGLSPVGALVLWSLATYLWLLPPVHRQAIQEGAVHTLDHLSFLCFGLLVWLAAFDFRRGVAVTDWETLRQSTTTCDLPWWGRHVYAMGSRLAMIPAVAILWLAPTASYYLNAQAPPGSWSQRKDQVNAASMMLGLEILLASAAVVLGLIWVSISEGRAREHARHP